MLVMVESLSVDFLKDLEDLDEEVDDVEVELDGRHDVLLGTQTGHYHLERDRNKSMILRTSRIPECRR